MLQGDEEEHAVLLTNYFLGIKKKAWLLIGMLQTTFVDFWKPPCISGNHPRGFLDCLWDFQSLWISSHSESFYLLISVWLLAARQFLIIFLSYCTVKLRGDFIVANLVHLYLPEHFDK